CLAASEPVHADAQNPPATHRPEWRNQQQFPVPPNQSTVQQQSTLNPWCFSSNGQKLESKAKQLIKKSMRKLIFVFHVMRHSHVHDGQDHEHKRLESNNQNMEYSPAPLQNTGKDTQHQTGAIHNCDQNKDHFTGIHVAKKTQSQ